MSLTSNLINILVLAQQNILLKNADLTNITLTNANIQSFETMNKTMEYNIELLNKRVDVLIIKLINLVLFLIEDKYKSSLLL
jgi:ABC-type uncharacterized transport system substrate-binding protein